MHVKTQKSTTVKRHKFQVLGTKRLGFQLWDYELSNFSMHTHPLIHICQLWSCFTVSHSKTQLAFVPGKNGVKKMNVYANCQVYNMTN